MDHAVIPSQRSERNDAARDAFWRPTRNDVAHDEKPSLSFVPQEGPVFHINGGIIIERRCIQNHTHTAVLRRCRVVVRCPIDKRKTRPGRQPRSRLWSEADACLGAAPADDRALTVWRRKDAQVRVYRIFSSRPTGMCPRAPFANSTTRSKGGAL
jgi:hypothetical protein